MKWLVVIGLLVACSVEREQPACTDCSLQGVHPAGYAMPGSDVFHGKDLERRGWDLAICQTCHGEDFRGKATAPSCMSCHDKEPTSCGTCHGDPPATAAHAAHLTKGLACADCHAVPATWADHRRPTSRTAIVTFGTLARASGAQPAWDGATCSGVYCHGSTLGDVAAASTRPRWTGGAQEAACGTCHGKPPASHAQNDCATCHSASTHVNGVVEVASTCAGGCHGDATSAAPTTGAHRKHLAGGFFRLGLACSECHRVPSAVGDAGHIDSAAPAEVVFGSLAGGAATWDRTTATCTNVYCHGASTTTWTGSGADNAYCGSCHGLPPADAPHTPAMQVTDCVTCHAATVTAFGGILVGGGKHINGVVDAN